MRKVAHPGRPLDLRDRQISSNCRRPGRATDTPSESLQIRPIDSGEIDETSEKIMRFDFRPRNIGPGRERKLIDEVFGRPEIVASAGLDEPRNDFDIEQPSCQKGLLK
jgi:hypothetical protein